MLPRAAGRWSRLCSALGHAPRMATASSPLEQLAEQRAACSSTSEGNTSNHDDRRKLINKMMYRSKQRGWLELDLLVGLWAEEHIPRMAVDMLHSYAAVLEEENPDLYKWLTGQLDAPEHMQENPAFRALRSHVQQQMAENSDSSTHAAAGKDWVRGWDDGSQQQQPAGAAS